ncbi:MAG: SDR family NAD(P)-dependent oxidoreductase [Acidimicrobiales bacterium]
MLDTTDRVAVISGANRGIGLAIARQLASEGYRLSLGARDIEGLKTVVAELPIDPDRLLLNHFDATIPETHTRWISRTIEAFGAVDVLVNNAGVLAETGVENYRPEELDKMWDVNVKAPIHLTHLTLPHLKESGSGRVLNVASMSGKRVAGDFIAGYAMTKHAVMALSGATRMAGWDDGVRVTSLCPGLVATDMTGVFDFPPDEMIQTEDLAELAALVLRLPNTAAVNELLINPTLEPT